MAKEGTLLIVDDNRSILAALRLLLEKEPCDIQRELDTMTPPDGVVWPPLPVAPGQSPADAAEAPAVRTPLTPQSAAAAPPTSVAELLEQGTVLILAQRKEGLSMGSGFFVAPGYIVTNAHVIADGQSVLVVLADARQYEAELVGFSSTEDLALLKLVDVTGLPTAQLGDSDECVVGDAVYAIGNPLGVELRGTLTNGIISAINRDVQVEGRVMTLLQTTAALNNGNSGGPLINEYGQVIGINTLKMSGTGSEEEATVEGLGFALPSSDVCFVVNDLIATGRFRGIPTLGVTVTNSPDNGGQVVVYTVEDGYGAAEAGIQPGDVLLKADGQPLHQINDLMAVRRTHLVDDTMTLTVLRDGRVFDVEVPLYANKG